MKIKSRILSGALMLFSANLIVKLAGAVYKIGKMVRIRRDILEEYLRQKQIIEQDS